MSGWRTAYFCVACNGRLSLEQTMHRRGRCPLCGYRDDRAITIVATYDRGYRLVPSGRWWQFWKPRRVEWGEAHGLTATRDLASRAQEREP